MAGLVRNCIGMKIDHGGAEGRRDRGIEGRRDRENRICRLDHCIHNNCIHNHSSLMRRTIFIDRTLRMLDELESVLHVSVRNLLFPQQPGFDHAEIEDHRCGLHGGIIGGTQVVQGHRQRFPLRVHVIG